jgi:hypothetical protein
MEPDIIKQVGPTTVNWSFDADPCIDLGEYRTVAIDPWPGHANGYFTIAHTLKKLREVFPLKECCSPLTVWNSLYEFKGRTNGLSERTKVEGRWKGDYHYVDTFDAHIVLSGKRIPIHPSMTRYVVAHEFGHQVQWWIAASLEESYDRLLEEYSEFRGIPYSNDCQGTNWPTASGEVFACDFRILVAGIEVEYWPHRGITHPLSNYEKNKSWWTEKLEMMKNEVHC